MRQRRRLCDAFAALFLMCVSAGHADAADPARGKKVFNKCNACHELGMKRKKVGSPIKGLVGRATASKVGPPLRGFLARPAASVDGFKYSKDFKKAAAAGLVWTEETFIAYIQNPRQFIGKIIGKKKANTSMVFPGIKKKQQAQDLLAYLKEATK